MALWDEYYFKKNKKRLVLTPSLPCEDTARRWPTTSTKKALTTHQICQHLDLGLLAFRTERNVCLSHLVSDRLLKQHELLS